MKTFKQSKTVKIGLTLTLVFFLFMLIYLFFQPGEELTAQEERWTAITHDKTNFPLVGKHRTVPCTDCHLKGVMQGTPTECEACHWYRKQDDRYRLQLGLHCDNCHTPLDWRTIKANAWEHEQVTGFRLEGIHKTMDCFQCHKNNMLTRQSSDCYDCHREEYQEARDPNHVAARFPMDCRVCHHSMLTWSGAIFDHSAFVLNGAHQTAACSDCHRNGQYSGLPSQCVDCHLEDYNNAVNPDHKNAGFPTNCESCHGTQAVSWQGAAFIHSTFTLRGNHQTAACSACHINGVYAGTSRDCVGCHLNDYNATQNPNHQQAGYSTDCESCHGSEALRWTGAIGSHTTFPLKGNHKTAACTDCHINGVYKGTPRECVGCHLNDYNSTRNPNHKQAGYSTDCESCHGSDALRWTGATVNHATFPLRGNHQTAACTDCHINGVYAGTPRNCVGCHLNDYNATRNPNHQQAGYSTDCVRCHSSDALRWTGAVVDHSFFPLRGHHQTAACTDCHINGVYAGTPRNCVGCHLDDYNASRNPNHQQAGFPTDCVVCHGSDAVTWQGAVFNHNQYWPLQGAHTALECNRCHANGYDLPRDCYGCHRADYEATTNPNHQATGFPTTCENCHFSTHVTWNQAVFNHQFPINSGAHRNIACNECHLTANYQQFSCIDCHTHNKNSTDSQHREVRGYSYNSQACYSCHPTGRAGD